MFILEYTEWVGKIFGLAKLLPPPIIKNKEYHEANWDTSEIPYKEDTIRKKSIMQCQQ